ncbi:MAG: hypothetical protein K2L83_09665 [Muribaculaceae bacterium]|nr:hypothetical protein [Muribaculaceae bacterium]
MNRLLTFSLSKNEIFNRIRLYTSYLAGKRAETAVDYDRIAAIEPDRPLLDLLMEDSASDMALRLADRVESFTVEGDVMRLRVINPLEAIGGTPDLDLLYRTLHTHVVADTIFRWLTVAGFDFPDGAVTARKATSDTASERMESLATLLKPVEPPTTADPTPGRRARSRRVPPI